MRARFLLEVALDRARLKERLSNVLFQERTKRGGGDARRFPQPKMADLLGYSLRQYQRLEDPNDDSLPTWDNLEAIAEKLEFSASEIFGDGDSSDRVEDEADQPAEPSEVMASLGRIEARLAEMAERLDALEGPQESSG